MRRALAIVGVVVVVAAVLSAPATAATPTEKKLQAQITALQGQTKAIKARSSRCKNR